MPMLPAAPGRLSITTGCAQIAASFSPTRRGIRSDAPPGAKGTITRTGFCGQVWAFERETTRSSAVRRRSRSMKILLDLGECALERHRMEPARIGIVAGLRSIEGRCSVVEGLLFLHKTRRSDEGAHHGARLVRFRVVQHRADRIRELARLAAELPVPVACTRRALRDAQRHD